MEAIKEKAVTIDGVPAPVECLEMKKDKNAPDLYAHFHDYVELIYLKSGKMKAWLNALEYNILEGELIIINSGESHRLESVSDTSEYYVVKFLPEILYAANGTGKETRYILPFLSATSSHPKVVPSGFPFTSDIPSLCADAVKEWSEKRNGYELALRGDVLKIFRCIVAYFDQFEIDGGYTVGMGSLYGVMSDVIDYINRHFAECDERELAKRYNVSYSYFSRSFKHIMNMSYKEYVKYLKVNESQRLLITTNKSVTEISDDLGFSSPSHFINVFKAQMGMAPKQYRKALADYTPQKPKKKKQNSSTQG